VPGDSIEQRWITYDKGGEFQPFLYGTPLVVDWESDGAACRAINLAKHGTDAQAMQSSKFWSRPGLNYMHVSSIGFSPRITPEGTVCSSESIGIYTDGSNPSAKRKEDLALLALLASAASQELVWVFGRYRKIENRAVSGLPIDRRLLAARLEKLAPLGLAGVQLLARVESWDQTSRRFVGPELSSLRGEGFPGEERAAVAAELASVMDQVDAAGLETFGLLSGESVSAKPRREYVDRVVFRTCSSPVDAVSEMVGFLVGVVFGRFGLGATFESPSEATAFCSLPMEPPAMQPPLSAGQGTPKANSAEPILVSDAGHSHDIGQMVEQVLQRMDLGGDPLVVTENALGGRAGDLEEFLRRRFFETHVRRFSKAHRKAPVFWQLATPSASYSVWCYYHRLTPDTFFRVGNDYVSSKVDHEERKLAALRQQAGPEPSSKQRKEISAQESFVAELRAFFAEVERIAPLWNPNLNDGVIINFAPLWRLVPQHKAWQKECKKVWDKLVKGDYDWAHLAMHLWPERVVSKCLDDRSLAITHGLEDEFWFEDDSGKKTVWTKRNVSSSRVAELIEQRSSTAVRAALDDLLSAPAPAGKTRSRRRKA